MGQESKAMKIRRCHRCGDKMWCSSKQLIEHAVLCERMEKLGLVLPESVRKMIPKNIRGRL